MVRIADILKRSRLDKGEIREEKSEEETVIKEDRFSSAVVEEAEKGKNAFRFPVKEPKEEARSTGEEPKKEASTEPVAKEIRKDQVNQPAPVPVKISGLVMEKTKVGGPRPEEIYEGLIALVKDIFIKGRKRIPIEGKDIVVGIDRLIERMGLGSEELIAMAATMSTTENYIYGHVANVCILSLKIGLELGYKRSRLNELGVAALLHDIGMVKVMDISQRPGKLTEKEYEAIKQHPIHSAEILEWARDISNVAIYVAREQHERMDGAGYPKGLKGEEITEYARIIGLVDTYEALTHSRPHREELLSLAAIREILKDKKQFDPRFLKILIEAIGVYPVGTWVELNNGEIGKVIKVNKSFSLQPTVNVIFSRDGRKSDEVKILDLLNHPTIYIKKPLLNSKLETKFKGSG